MNSLEMESLAPIQIDEICAGLACEWYLDKRIVVYKLTAVTHKVIEVWADTVVQTIQEWPEDLPYLAIHDLSTPGVSLQYASFVNFDTTNIGITDDGRQQVFQMIDARPNFFAQVAFNFSMSLSGQVNRLLADRQNRHPFIQYKLFYGQNRALAWLTETMTPEIL